MKIQGLLYDIARGLRGDVKYIEELIPRLSSYGYNMLVLHLEYRFQFRSHPVIGPEDSLRPEDVVYLDGIAKEYGIELVPCVNCAGHCEGILLLEKYKSLGVDPTGMTKGVEQLIVGDEKALNLIKELYTDIMNSFSSKYFHIGGDEVRRLDVQLPHLSEEERWPIALEHVLSIIDFVKERGKIPMIWGDMFLKHRECINRVSDDVIICDWEYFDRPSRSGPGNIEGQRFFKEAGKRVLASPAINGFYGHPLVSVNSTENIRAFTSDNQAVDGDGILLCTWETNFGSFFSSHWPWIKLQSDVIRGTDSGGMEFLREYTRDEWGLDSDALKEWYELIDVEVQKILSPYSDLPFTLICILRHQVFRTKNILPPLYDSRSWLGKEVRSELLDVLGKAKKVAEGMYDKAVRRREEPLRLLQWTDTFICILQLAELVDELEKSYHEAAIAQGSDSELFVEALNRCVSILQEMVCVSKPLGDWTETLVKYENQVAEEKWWIPQAQKDLAWRGEELKKVLENNRSLINFNRFIRFDPDIPNRVMNR